MTKPRMKTTRLETRTKEFWRYASVMVTVKPITRSESKFFFFYGTLFFVSSFLLLALSSCSFLSFWCDKCVYFDRVISSVIATYWENNNKTNTLAAQRKEGNTRERREEKERTENESTIPRSGTFISLERVQKKWKKWGKSINPKTRKMVNYACRGWSQRKLWWKLVAVLTCKSIVTCGYRGERPIEPSSSWFLSKFISV